MKVAVFGVLRFLADQVQLVLPHLKALVDAMYKYDGCLLYEATLDPFDHGLIRFSELWPNRECLTRHLQVPHIAPWRNIAKSHGLMERRFESYDIESTAIAV